MDNEKRERYGQFRICEHLAPRMGSEGWDSRARRIIIDMKKAFNLRRRTH